MYLCKESSPACTPAIRPGTTIGHKIPGLTPSCCAQACVLPANVNVSHWGRWKCEKVSRTVTVLLSVLQKWTWAFPISIKLAPVNIQAQHPGKISTIKAWFKDIRQDFSKEKARKSVAVKNIMVCLYIYWYIIIQKQCKNARALTLNSFCHGKVLFIGTMDVDSHNNSKENEG